MAVNENARGRGYGSRILEGLEAEATRRGAQKLVLNARNNVTEFYAKHGYAMIGEAETLFRRDSPCADGESVVVMIYNKIAWITIYVGVITYLFSALIVSSACYQLIVVGNPTCQ